MKTSLTELSSHIEKTLGESTLTSDVSVINSVGFPGLLLSNKNTLFDK